MGYARKCGQCGVEFIAPHSGHRWPMCSDECRRIRERDRGRERRQQTASGPHNLQCQRCREPFISKRSDARYCGGTCRVAALRAARKDGNETGPEEHREPAKRISARSSRRHEYVRDTAVSSLSAALHAVQITIDTAHQGLDPSISPEDAARMVKQLQAGHGAYTRLVNTLKERTAP